MSNPTDLKYTDDHEWVRIEGDVATVGITAHAAQTLSDLVFIDLPEVGDDLTSGSSFGEIESVKAVSDLNAPMDGEVVAVNDELADNLTDVASDPYGKGWMVKIKFSGSLDGMMDAAAYEAHVAAAS
ncbi:MAG: glycine cleavage system protein GcvH [Planctomycetota bacterium]|nr:MAG: glycine cleavage system protein GcvH [Planctomycetota bacterium]